MGLFDSPKVWVRGLKFEEINLKFKKSSKKFKTVKSSKEFTKIKKCSDPHPITKVTGRHLVFSIL